LSHQGCQRREFRDLGKTRSWPKKKGQYFGKQSKTIKKMWLDVEITQNLNQRSSETSGSRMGKEGIPAGDEGGKKP